MERRKFFSSLLGAPVAAASINLIKAEEPKEEVVDPNYELTELVINPLEKRIRSLERKAAIANPREIWQRGSR